MDARELVIDQIVHHLVARNVGHPLRVGVDGVVGTGKTTFANELVERLQGAGRPAIHLDSDGFHHVRAVRYRQGRESARGYYDDAYDFDSLANRVLLPLGAAAPFTYASKVHDLISDVKEHGVARADPNAIVVFACTFLQRGALRELWDEVIWLDADRSAAMSRGVGRDAEGLGGEAAARSAYASRYMAACDLYLAEEDPVERASIVIEHSDPSHPRLVRI